MKTAFLLVLAVSVSVSAQEAGLYVRRPQSEVASTVKPQAAPVDRLTTLKAAYAAGKTIQLWSQEKQNWFDVIGEPRWNSRPEWYQVKPEPESPKEPQVRPSPEQQARWMAEAREAAKPKPDPVSEALKNLPQFIEAKRQQEQQDRIESLLERQAFLLFQQQYGQK